MATAAPAALPNPAGAPVSTPRARGASFLSSSSPRRPLDDAAWRARLPRGQVHLISERCKGCRLCVEFCPQQVLVLSSAMNAKGYHFPVVAPGKQEACVACGFCSLICPEFAIFATEKASQPEGSSPGPDRQASGEVRP